jgi:integrase/recombinase XerD
MSALAPTLQSFFTSYLLEQRAASSNTVTAYRDTWRLLLTYLRETRKLDPSRIDFTDLGADTIIGFLTYLEQERGNSPATRNARLAGIHALFHYAAYSLPEHADLIARVLAITPKRRAKPDISYLTDEQVNALLAAPSRHSWAGRRDQLMILILVTTGLRVSELTTLTWSDTNLQTPAYIRCHGKGRKDRTTPLSPETRAQLQHWHTENIDLGTDDPIFPAQGTRRPMTTDAITQRLAVHTTAAAKNYPTLIEKNITPHVLRHTTAMRMVAAGIDVATISLWLGHESIESTQAYLHADMTIKQAALDRTAPPNTAPGRYKPSDALLKFLEDL